MPKKSSCLMGMIMSSTIVPVWGEKNKEKKKENRQFSSFFLEWGCQAMNKALRCPAWSCAPCTSCTAPVWLAPASRDVTRGHRAARQAPSHSSKDMLLSCRRDTTAVGMASVHSQWSMSHESSPGHPDSWRMLG